MQETLPVACRWSRRGRAGAADGLRPVVRRRAGSL